MKISAIICEYNPFHNGHKYQIDQTKKITNCDAIIVIMSGNFVQRGDIAIYEKNIRAKAALSCGADLVLELPAIFGVQSAEFFAKNSVYILDALNSVDYLSFGSEIDDIEKFNEVASLLADETEDFKDSVKKHVKDGISFPVARQKALNHTLGYNVDFLTKPNCILGLEYVKSLIKLKSNIRPLIIKRENVGHDSLDTKNNFASATKVRDLILKGYISEALNYIPKECYEILSSVTPKSISNLEKSIIANLHKTSTDNLSNIADVSEGLENKIKKEVLNSSDLDSLISSIKSKRYTQSRIRRIILNSYLGITKYDQHLTPQYIKILDFNDKGQKILNKTKKAAKLPLIKNMSQIKKLNNPLATYIWNKELTFDRIYNLF